jgi:hypothetical protein
MDQKVLVPCAVTLGIESHSHLPSTSPAAPAAPSTRYPTAIGTALKRRQMALLRCLLQVAQNPQNVRPLGTGQQALIHGAIGDLGCHTRLASRLQGRVTLNLAKPWIWWNGQAVARK